VYRNLGRAPREAVTGADQLNDPQRIVSVRLE
jgi:hypothetical protein